MDDASPEMLSIFAGAIERPTSGERAAFLDTACGADLALRVRIEALLRAHNEAGGFLRDRSGASDPAATGDQSVSEGPGTVIGPYKLLEQIGEGGFGTVFMAEQTQPVRRRVALKVVKPGMDSRQVVARFEAERQALAIMDHPNIAKVFDAGTVGGEQLTVGSKDRARNTDPSSPPTAHCPLPTVGRPYFVMELVKGVPITQYCDQNHLTPRERLELFVQVCQAIQHAHQKGIIHRDIKPSNVLVTVHDTTPVVKVIDFGIAKALGQELTEKTLFTGFAQMVGTPLYMSPEQAGQSGLDIDTRSDVYSLGVLLYELLTGTTPFTAERFKRAAYDEIRRIIREEEPPRPSTRLSELSGTDTPRAVADTRSMPPTSSLASVAALRHTEPARLTKLVRGELDWIVMKCLEKDRNRRYDTANAFAADVQRYLNDEPVQACPPSVWYRFRKLARRNRRTLATVSVLALAAFVGIGALAVSTVLVWKANQDLKGSIERERLAVERERREAYFQRITVAHRELSTDNLAAALRALQECPEDLRGWEWHYLMRSCRRGPLFITNDSEVNGVAFSLRGDRLAAACGDGSVKLWDSTTLALVVKIPAHDGSVISIAFHPNGNHVATRGADRTVKVWDLTTDPAVQVFDVPCDDIRKFGTANSIAFSPDGRLLATGTGEVVKVWDWKNRQLLQELPGHASHSVPVAFSSDGRLATAAFREGLKLWDPETGTLLRTIDGHREPVSALAFSTDGKWLASASLRSPLKLSDSIGDEPGCTFNEMHSGNVECVGISPDGRRIASGGEDKTVRVWDAATGREILGLRGHTERCACVAYSPDGRCLASASADRTIRIWDGSLLREDEHGEEMLTFEGHSNEIRSVAVSPDGRQLASTDGDGTVKVWDPQTGREIAVFRGHKDISGQRIAVFGVTWHPKRHLVASTSLHGVLVWDPRTDEEVFRIPVGSGKVGLPYATLAFSPDGRYLVTGKHDAAVQVWDGQTGERVGMLDTHKREIRGVAFSPDGAHLASASSDGEVKLWDAKRLGELRSGGKLEPRIPPIRARVAGPGLSMAFSPDSRWLVTGGEENTVRVWDVETGRELRSPLRGHTGDIYAVAVSPDGRWVASGSEDSTVKVWDSRNGFRLVRSFRGHMDVVTSVAFAAGPDGLLLVSGSRDHTAKVWDVSKLRQESNH